MTRIRTRWMTALGAVSLFVAACTGAAGCGDNGGAEATGDDASCAGLYPQMS